MLLVLFFLVSFLFLLNSDNLLLSLLILELLGFVLLCCFVTFTFTFSPIDCNVLVLFSIFVIEGVIGLSGLISLVSFTGSDYLSSSSLSNF